MSKRGADILARFAREEQNERRHGGNDGERAHVRWTATMQYTLNLGDTRKSGERTIDTTFELTKFEGTWYLRNAKLPDA